MQYKDFLKGVNYLLTEEEVEVLAKYASEVPNHGLIVDIGTAAGGSAFIFTLESKIGVRVYTIDPVANEAFVLKKEELFGKLRFINKTSEEASSMFTNEKIDLLFVDGIHNYQGVMDDFNNFKPRGIVIFHDYYLYGDTIGKAVDELEATGRIEKIEIIDSLYHGEIRTGMYIARCK